MKNFLKSLLTTVIFVLVLTPISLVNANESKKIATYVGGIGCPHCAVVSPFLHEKVEEGGFILFEYEMYKNVANASVLNSFADNYGTSLGVPLLVFGKGNTNSGDTPIINNWDSMFESAKDNEVFLPDGSNLSWDELSISDIDRYPRIYAKDRVAIRESLSSLSKDEEEVIKQFIFSDNVNDVLPNIKAKVVRSERVDYPGGSVKYDNAASYKGWLLQWNGDSIEDSGVSDSSGTVSSDSNTVSIGRTIMLALADSVNPCALSVLTLMFISIITYNPGNRKQILLSGLAFVLAVIIMYLFYGFLIVTAFNFIQGLASIKLYLYKGLAIGAVILGLLEIKDFIIYKPGSVGTEMPLFLRPKVQKLIAKVTSPLGAFGVGLFVTLFLLPCTIGPYVILGGMIAQGGFIKAIPLLILYNIIFVLPMLVITILVFLGSKKIEDVADWKEKNVRKMHLVAGALILVVGILMLFGII